MSNKGYLAIIGILLLLCGGIGYKFYSLKQSTTKQIEDLNVENQESEIEKQKLEIDLQKMLISYDTLQTENEEILHAMAEQRIEIEDLLKKVRYGNAQIGDLKAEAGTLRRIMQDYVHEIDSLNTLTQNLTAQVGDLETEVQQRNQKIEGLEEKTGNLEEMVASGQTLQSNGMSSQGIRLTNSGNQKEATRASRVDMFKTCFSLIKNPIAEPGNKTLYMKVISPSGKILPAEGGTKSFTFDGENTAYSVSRTIDYRNESMDVCIYYTASGDLESGDYTVFVYEGSKKIGSTELTLK